MPCAWRGWAPISSSIFCCQAVAPAYVNTKRLQVKVYQAMPGILDQTLAQIPLGRLAEPDDISKAVEFFVTDLGDYVTSQCLSVCGGAIKFS